MSKLSKDEIKKPDALTKELKKGFEWTAQHSNLVLGLVGVFILAGGGYSVYQWMQISAEKKLQSQYFSIEKQYLEKKTKFDQFAAKQAEPVKAEKNKKVEDNEDKGLKPTGDLDQDYGSVLAAFEKFVTEKPASSAAKMSALQAAGIYLSYKQPEKAIAVLNKVRGSGDTLSAMVFSQMGTAFADKGDCKSAIDTWSKVLSNKKVGFLYPEVKLKQGICYEALKDVASAEKLYMEVKEANAGSISSSAENYLRALKTVQ